MRPLALYLPQYHEIPENNKWWGEGYTEWTAVKNAKPLYVGHQQPKKPLNGRYYDLSEKSGCTWRWQAKLARSYGIHGFCIYHYWFGEKQLLEKPAEILLNNKDIDINYTFCWANETWTRTWYDKSSEILLEQKYGDESNWRKHYEYLSRFFKDKRYIKVNNSPVFHIYKQGDIDCLDDMLALWDRLAKEDGFNGIYIVVAKTSINNKKITSKYIKGQYLFEPGFSTRNGLNIFDKIRHFVPIEIRHLYNQVLNKNILERKINIAVINKRIIKNYLKERQDRHIKTFAGICPRWDNTPRRGYKGTVYYNTGVKTFKKLLDELIMYIPENDFVYINAWNEWGEGCYLEPDDNTRYSYLKAVKNCFRK